MKCIWESFHGCQTCYNTDKISACNKKFIHVLTLKIKSSWCQLCGHWWHSRESDNLQCQQWSQRWHYDNCVECGNNTHDIHILSFLLQRVRGSARKSTSNPTSPVTQPRRAISTPEELALQDAIDAGFVVPPGGDDRSPSVDSSQRSGHSEGPNTIPRQRPRTTGYEHHPGHHPGPCDYENPYAVSRARPHSDIMGNSVNQQQMPRDLTEPIYASVRNIREPLPNQIVDDDTDTNANLPRKLSKPELRQFSREPTVLRIAPEPNGAEQEYLSQEMKDDVGQITIQIRDKDGHQPLSPPRKSQSSSSPEWPPPPDPITPISPETPAVHTSFDSNTLRKMLRNLAPSETSPDGNTSHTADRGATERGATERGATERGATLTANQPQSTSSSPIRGMHQPGANPTPQSRHSTGQCSHLDLAHPPAPDGRPPIPARPQSYVMDCRELSGRARKHDYPDSGISLTHDNTGSVKSGDSGRSNRSNRSATLPPGECFGIQCGAIITRWNLSQIFTLYARHKTP